MWSISLSTTIPPERNNIQNDIQYLKLIVCTLRDMCSVVEGVVLGMVIQVVLVPLQPLDCLDIRVQVKHKGNINLHIIPPWLSAQLN